MSSAMIVSDDEESTGIPFRAQSENALAALQLPRDLAMEALAALPDDDMIGDDEDKMIDTLEESIQISTETDGFAINIPSELRPAKAKKSAFHPLRETNVLSTPPQSPTLPSIGRMPAKIKSRSRNRSGTGARGRKKTSKKSKRINVEIRGIMFIVDEVAERAFPGPAIKGLGEPTPVASRTIARRAPSPVRSAPTTPITHQTATTRNPRDSGTSLAAGQDTSESSRRPGSRVQQPSPRSPVVRKKKDPPLSFQTSPGQKRQLAASLARQGESPRRNLKQKPSSPTADLLAMPILTETTQPEPVGKIIKPRRTGSVAKRSNTEKPKRKQPPSYEGGTPSVPSKGARKAEGSRVGVAKPSKAGVQPEGSRQANLLAPRTEPSSPIATSQTKTVPKESMETLKRKQPPVTAGNESQSAPHSKQAVVQAPASPSQSVTSKKKQKDTLGAERIRAGSPRLESPRRLQRMGTPPLSPQSRHSFRSDASPIAAGRAVSKASGKKRSEAKTTSNKTISSKRAPSPSRKAMNQPDQTAVSNLSGSSEGDPSRSSLAAGSVPDPFHSLQDDTVRSKEFSSKMQPSSPIPNESFGMKYQYSPDRSETDSIPLCTDPEVSAVREKHKQQIASAKDNVFAALETVRSTLSLMKEDGQASSPDTWRSRSPSVNTVRSGSHATEEPHLLAPHLAVPRTKSHVEDAIANIRNALSHLRDSGYASDGMSIENDALLGQPGGKEANMVVTSRRLAPNNEASSEKAADKEVASISKVLTEGGFVPIDEGAHKSPMHTGRPEGMNVEPPEPQKIPIEAPIATIRAIGRPETMDVESAEPGEPSNQTPAETSLTMGRPEVMNVESTEARKPSRKTPAVTSRTKGRPEGADVESPETRKAQIQTPVAASRTMGRPEEMDVEYPKPRKPSITTPVAASVAMGKPERMDIESAESQNPSTGAPVAASVAIVKPEGMDVESPEPQKPSVSTLVATSLAMGKPERKEVESPETRKAPIQTPVAGNLTMGRPEGIGVESLEPRKPSISDPVAASLAMGKPERMDVDSPEPRKPSIRGPVAASLPMGKPEGTDVESAESQKSSTRAPVAASVAMGKPEGMGVESAEPRKPSIRAPVAASLAIGKPEGTAVESAESQKPSTRAPVPASVARGKPEGMDVESAESQRTSTKASVAASVAMGKTERTAVESAESQNPSTRAPVAASVAMGKPEGMDVESAESRKPSIRAPVAASLAIGKPEEMGVEFPESRKPSIKTPVAASLAAGRSNGQQIESAEPLKTSMESPEKTSRTIGKSEGMQIESSSLLVGKQVNDGPVESKLKDISMTRITEGDGSQHESKAGDQESASVSRVKNDESNRPDPPVAPLPVSNEARKLGGESHAAGLPPDRDQQAQQAVDAEMNQQTDRPTARISKAAAAATDHSDASFESSEFGGYDLESGDMNMVRANEIDEIRRSRKERMYAAIAILLCVICIVCISVGLSVANRDRSAPAPVEIPPEPTQNVTECESIEVNDVFLQCLCTGTVLDVDDSLLAKYKNITISLVASGAVDPSALNDTITSCNPSSFSRLVLAELDVEESDMVATYAAAVLYRILGGFEWTSQDLWCRTPNVCEWQNVQCDSGREINRLVLADNNLRGSIPTEMSLLTSLLEIELQDNNIFGPVPRNVFDRFEQLRRIDLSNNRVSGRLFDIVPIESPITDISLRNTFVSGEIDDDIGLMENLVRIDFSDTRFRGMIPAALGNLGDLQDLNLSSCALTGTLPPDLGSMSSAISIDLHQNSIEGTIPETFADLEQLEFLDLADTRITGTIPASMCDLPRIQSIVGNCYGNFTAVANCSCCTCAETGEPPI